MSGAEVVLVGVLSVVVFLLLVLLTLQIWLAVRLRGERQIARPRLPERGEELPASQALADELSFYGSVLRVEMGGDTGRLFRLRPKGSTWIGRDNSVQTEAEREHLDRTGQLRQRHRPGQYFSQPQTQPHRERRHPFLRA